MAPIATRLVLISAFLTAGCGPTTRPSTPGAVDSEFGSQVDMEYVDICDRENRCKKFSRLVMGTDHLVQANWSANGQPQLSEEEVHELLDEAAKLGINFFDTAPIYVGGIESKLGKWLKSRKETVRPDAFYYREGSNPDRRLYVLSKGGFPFDLFGSQKLEAGTHSPQLKKKLAVQGFFSPDSERPDGSAPLKNVPPGTYASRLFGSEAQITKRVAEELGHTEANLGDRPTIYLMHRDDGDFVRFDRVPRDQTPVKTIMTALSDESIRGKFWEIGWSNWQTERVEKSLSLATESNQLVKPVLNSPYFSLFEMSQRTIHAGGVQVTHDEMQDPQFQSGIKIMPYSPLGGFSILDKPEPRWENAKRAAKDAMDKGDPYWQNVFHAIFTEENRVRYERVKTFTDEFNVEHESNFTIDQMINAYALAHERTDFLAVGPITIEQLRRTVGSLRLARMLTDRDLEYLHGGD